MTGQLSLFVALLAFLLAARRRRNGRMTKVSNKAVLWAKLFKDHKLRKFLTVNLQCAMFLPPMTMTRFR